MGLGHSVNVSIYILLCRNLQKIIFTHQFFWYFLSFRFRFVRSENRLRTILIFGRKTGRSLLTDNRCYFHQCPYLVDV